MFRSLARAVAVAGATALALTACGGSTSPAPSAAPAGTVSVTDATGQVVDVPTSPTRVVVFDMSLLDSLDTLGVPVAGLPKQNVPEFLAEYRDARYADVGTLFEANLEAVQRRRPRPDPRRRAVRRAEGRPDPDRADAGPDDGQQPAHGRLRAQRPHPGHRLRQGGGGREAPRRAEHVDHRDEGPGSGRRTRTDRAHQRHGGHRVRPGSRFGIIHDVLGVPPAIPDVEAATHGEAISFELIAQTNPDRMFVVDRDAATGNPANAQQVLNNELVTGTAAWRNGDVTYLDPTRWYIANAGLSTLPASVEEIRASLQAA